MKKFIGFFLFAFLMSACQRDIQLATVQSDLLFPIAFGELDLKDYVDQEQLGFTNSDTLVLQVNDTILSLGLADIVGIPDTTITNEYEVPIAGISFPPGVPFHGDTIATRYQLGDAKLKYAELRTGSIKVKLTNTIDKPIVFTYHLISAVKDGVSFLVTETVGANSIFTKTYSLAEYELDLRGPDQNTFNALSATYSIMIDPNETSNYTFKSGEKFTVENTFQNIVPNYLTGFFGSKKVNLNEQVETPLFQQYPFDYLDIEKFDLTFIVDNGIGADLQLNINEVSSIASNSLGNATLTHPMINDAFQINRASQLYDENNLVKHLQKTFVFNNQNSNLDELIENAPRAMSFDMDVFVNPFGNISLGNDFAFYGHDLSVMMQGELPLALGLGGLHLVDTSAYNFNLTTADSVYTNRLNSGVLRIEFENGFPIEAYTQLYVLGSEGTIIDSLFASPTTLEGAQVENLNLVPQKSVFEIPLNAEKLSNFESGNNIVADVYLSTTNREFVQINSQSRVSYKMVAQLNADL